MNVEYLNPETLSAPPGGMYSQAVRVRAGEQLYISGQVARDQEGRLVGEAVAIFPEKPRKKTAKKKRTVRRK